MSSVTTLKPPLALPADLPGRLQQMAADVESGRVTAMFVACVCDGCYEFLWPSSAVESLTLADLAHASALDRMRT